MDHSGDGWGYACEILKHNFLSGHHLLYNITGYLWLQLFSWLPFSPIKVLTWMNIVFSSGILLVSYKIIKQTVNNELLTVGILLFGASCFGFYRYSLENETYILPLFFGVISLYYLNDSKRLKFTWIAASIACLFHQIYIFWLIPILAQTIQKTRNIWTLWYSIILVLTPYLLASYIYKTNIYDIVFQDVNNGIVNNNFNIKNFLIGCINLFRSITEIHGRIGLMVLKIPVYRILGIFLLTGFIYVSIKSYKNIKNIDVNKLSYIFKLPEFYILISTILFSFYSNGNAEFMVSIPFLIVFIVIKQLKESSNINLIYYFLFFSIINLSWNSIFYLIPVCDTNVAVNTRSKVELINSVINQDKNIKNNKPRSYCNKINKNTTDLTTLSNSASPSNMPDTVVYISSDAASLYNCLDFFRLWKNQNKITEILFLYPDDSISLTKYRNCAIYTDLNSDKIINRANLTLDHRLNKKEFLLIDSIKSKTSIYRISKIR